MPSVKGKARAREDSDDAKQWTVDNVWGNSAFRKHQTLHNLSTFTSLSPTHLHIFTIQTCSRKRTVQLLGKTSTRHISTLNHATSPS